MVNQSIDRQNQKISVLLHDCDSDVMVLCADQLLHLLSLFSVRKSPFDECSNFCRFYSTNMLSASTLHDSGIVIQPKTFRIRGSSGSAVWSSWRKSSFIGRIDGLILSSLHPQVQVVGLWQWLVHYYWAMLWVRGRIRDKILKHFRRINAAL